MNRTPFRIQVSLLITLAVVGLSACGSTQVTLAPRDPGTPKPVITSTAVEPGGAGSTPETEDGATAQALPCLQAEGVLDEGVPYVADIPDEPVPVGAGGEEEEGLELNEGTKPVLPVDPNANLDNNIAQPYQMPASGSQDNPMPDDVIIYKGLRLDEGASQVTEPNVAVNGQHMVVTWNRGAARSFDGGATFQKMVPYDDLGRPDDPSTTSDDHDFRVDGGFCCDQLVQYVPSHDMWLWVMQTYTAKPGDTGGNRIRLRVALGEGKFDRYFDFRSADSGLNADWWYDQPKIGTSNGFMTLSINVFDSGRDWQAAVMYRVALDELAAGQTTQPDCIVTYDVFGPHPVRIADDVMYIVGHSGNTKRVVWRWPDAERSATRYDVVAKNSAGGDQGYPYPTKPDGSADYHCPRDGGGVAADWCAGSDERITSAFLVNGQIGIAWNAGQWITDDPNTTWAYPSLWVEMVDETRLTGCSQRYDCVTRWLVLASNKVAVQYGGIIANERGDLGMVALVGGGDVKPSCQPFIHSAGSAASWDNGLEMYTSRNDTVEGQWGHYLGIWPGPTQSSFTGGCMTFDGGDRFNSGTPRFITFGRRADQPAQ